MAAISPFYLFNLPTIAIHDIFKMMIPLELIQLSSVSRKTKKIIASFSKRNSAKNRYKLKMSIAYPYKRLDMKLYQGERDLLKIEFRETSKAHSQDSRFPNSLIKLDGINEFVRVNNITNCIRTYWELDWKIHIEAVKTMLQYFCKIFNPVLSINFNEHGDMVTGVLDLIKIEKTKLDEISLTFNPVSRLILQKLLDLPARKLNILSRPFADFCYKPSAEPMKFEELKITDADWVTNLNDFLNCKRVILENTKLKAREFNKFLKKWTESDYPLEYASISVHSFLVLNLGSIVEGLSVRPMNRACIGNRFQNFQDGKCFGIQQSTGNNAIVYQLDTFSVIIQTESIPDSPRF